MQDSDLPVKFPIPWADGASGGFIRAVPQASQIGVSNGAASLTDGFPPNCFLPIASGGSWPFAQDFNGILKQITQWARWYSAGGAIPYDATFQAAIGGYPKGAIVGSATIFGNLWMSLVGNNTSNPDTGGAGWRGIWYGFSTAATWVSSATWTCPPGITRVKSRLWGAGGGSGATWAVGSAALGGGGGGYSEGLYTVVPGSGYAMTVGQGGSPGVLSASPTNGGNGGSTSFASFHSATGGQGGVAANGVTASGVSGGGAGTGGNIANFTGETSSSPFAIPSGVVTSQGGSAPMGGSGGHLGATAISSTGGPGTFPGGGAGGSAEQAAGGTGANGYIILEF